MPKCGRCPPDRLLAGPCLAALAVIELISALVSSPPRARVLDVRPQSIFGHVSRSKRLTPSIARSCSHRIDYDLEPDVGGF